MKSVLQDRRRWFSFNISLTIFVLLGISGGLLNIAWTPMQSTFNIDVGSIGILLLFATTGAMIATFASGTIFSLIRFNITILLALLLLGIGLLAIAFTGNWLVLLVVMFVTYMGRGILDAGLNHHFSEHFDTSALNWLHASWGIGLTIAPAVMTFILTNLMLPWQAGYIFIAIVVFSIGALVAINNHQWDGNLSDNDGIDSQPTESEITFFGALQDPLVLLSMLIFFLYGGIEIGTGQLANTLLVDGRQLSQQTAGYWLSLYWGSFTAGRIALGWLALRFTSPSLLRYSMVLATLGALLLAWNPMQIMGLSGLICIGLGLSGIFPILISLTPKRLGRAISKQAIGLQIGSAGLGASIIPGLIGVLAGQFSLEWISLGILLNVIIFVVVYEITKLFLDGDYSSNQMT